MKQASTSPQPHYKAEALADGGARAESGDHMQAIRDEVISSSARTGPSDKSPHGER